MRLSKKIAAVALAAVMSVSLLTACGGTDAPSSSNPGSSSSSSSSSSAGSSSSSGSTSDSSSASSSSGSSSNSSSNSSTEDKEENVAYKDSRTGRFYQKLGTSYTLGTKLEITADGNSQLLDMLVVTNGSRTYQQTTLPFGDITGKQTVTVLIDQAKQKEWHLDPSDDEIVKDQGKLGYCWSATISEIGVFKPDSGLKFKKETKGNYYIETQSAAGLTGNGLVKGVISYYYKGNSIVPEYAELEQSFGSEGAFTERITFTHVEYKADAKYLDFETILKQYIDITDQMNPSTVQAMNPSIAGLNIG